MDKVDFEKRVARLYRRFAPLAQRYYYTFSRPSVTVGGTPAMLFLGNHSSGKSSLVNELMGGSTVQDTGVAPTDDGFTVLVYGESERDVCGPAALEILPQEFRALEAFGPALLQRLCVKVRNRELLKGVSLVDTPGMIDAAEGAATRDYDFPSVVRRLAEICDLVFFLFDPEKPGTTGETVNVFAQSLRGMEFKLRVLLNKCDTFKGPSDFARAYGTLCWNLSRVLSTKDLPKILTTYSGEIHPVAQEPFDYSDFNRHRVEFREMVQDAGSRRADNVYAAAHADFTGLSIRMRVVNLAARRLCLQRVRILSLTTVATLVVGAAIVLVFANALKADVQILTWRSVLAWFSAAAGMVAMGFLAHLCDGLVTRLMRERQAEQVDELFRESYRMEMAVAQADDLKQRWDALRAETAEIIRRAPLNLPWFGERRRAALDAALAGLKT